MEFAESIRKSEDLACCFRSINKKGVRVLWETTKLCNMNCLHCLAREKSKNELNTQECIKIIEQFPSIGVRKVLFSGGEPLLRKDIFKLISMTTKLNIHTDLNTNASLITAEIVKKLKDAGLRELTISLDGACDETYQKVRGQNTFSNVLNAFKVLKEEGLEFDLTCVASKINYKEIGDVIDLAHNYGAGSITINNMFHKDNAVKNWDKLALTKKEKDFVIKTILAKRKQYKNVLPIRTLRLIKTHPLEPCGAAESFVFIDADGLMHPCSLLVSKNSNYNDLRTHSLKDIFNSKEFEQVKKDSRNPIICPDCDRRNECGLGCRGYGYTFENNFFLKDPFCNK